MSVATTINQKDLVTSLSRSLTSSIIKNEMSFQYRTTLNDITVVATIHSNEARTNIDVNYSFQNDSSLLMLEFESFAGNFKKEFKNALNIAFYQITGKRML